MVTTCPWPNTTTTPLSVTRLEAAVAACGDFTTESPACLLALAEANGEVGNNVDVYDLYSGDWDNCVYARKLRRMKRSVHPQSFLGRILARQGASLKDNNCTNDDDLTTYLNLPAVQTALHVKPKSWEECGGIEYTSTEADERTIIYPTLIEKAGYHVVIFNGQSDVSAGKMGGRCMTPFLPPPAFFCSHKHHPPTHTHSLTTQACVPVTDNQWWTRSMGYPEKNKWTSWTASDGSNGGYLTTYNPPGTGSFSFAVVRGAGKFYYSPTHAAASAPGPYPTLPPPDPPTLTAHSTPPTPTLGHMVGQTQPLYAYDLAHAFIMGSGAESLLAGGAAQKKDL